MIGAAKMGVDLRILAPPELSPSPALVKELMNEAAVGARILVTREPREALEGCDAVYNDVWVSMGEEDLLAERVALLRGFKVTPRLMALTGRARHDLPALPAGAARRLHRVRARPPRGVRGGRRGVREPAEPRLRPGREPHAHRQGGDGADGLGRPRCARSGRARACASWLARPARHVPAGRNGTRRIPPVRAALYFGSGARPALRVAPWESGWPFSWLWSRRAAAQSLAKRGPR